MFLCLALPSMALADGPTDPGTGMARLVDGMALQEAFKKAPAGDVEIAFELSDDGKVLHPKIVKSTPSGIFDAAALSIVDGARLPHRDTSSSEAAKSFHLIVHFKVDAEPQTRVDSTN
jgi:TonB family protein